MVRYAVSRKNEVTTRGKSNTLMDAQKLSPLAQTDIFGAVFRPAPSLANSAVTANNVF